ncbi:MAG: bacteriohemerythrin [Sulfuritalea sp.]|nr:bacteriohemerythrin [Sulfuritalea sp.]
MHIIEWTDEFALGIDEIDAQHRTLVDMINALDASTHDEPGPETMRRLLAQLSDYVRDHFGLEERLMAGSSCSPELVTRHFGEHAYFRSVLKDLTAEFENGGRSISTPLIEYLVHWLLHHIAVVDRAMTHQLNAAEPELAARVAAIMMRDASEELTGSERRLLTELRRANEDVERQVQQRTQALSERNSKLEAELAEMSALVERLSRVQAAPRAAR